MINHLSFVYFLKLSNISFAISFQPSPKAKPQAIESIEINQINIVCIIQLSIQTLSNTIISVKNNIITFAQAAIILAVFCLVKVREWYTTSYIKPANLKPKYHTTIHINKFGKYVITSFRNCSTSVIQITTIDHLKNNRNT